MKLKLCACLVLGMLACATQVVAQPVFSPFLAVDVNGFQNSEITAVGPTQDGFEGMLAQDSLFGNWSSSGAAGITQSFATSQGNIDVTITGVAPNSGLGARDRGANAGALPALYQDFIFANRGVDGFGQHFIKIAFSGLVPSQTYEFTGYAREPFNGGVDDNNTSYQAWSDIDALGGLDGPGAWMDTNVSAGALYQPVWGSVDHDMDPNTPNVDQDTGYKNPIPTLVRAPISGPDSDDPYAYAATLLSTADANGNLTVYTWSDPQSYSNTQTVSLLNGFQLAAIPEPASLALLGMALVGAALRRSR